MAFRPPEFPSRRHAGPAPESCGGAVGMSADLIGTESYLIRNGTEAEPPCDVAALDVPEGVDTVVVCMVDMQGRLVGKRLTARHMRENSGDDVHACDYLLGVDTEMVPIPGLAATGW